MNFYLTKQLRQFRYWLIWLIFLLFFFVLDKYQFIQFPRYVGERIIGPINKQNTQIVNFFYNSVDRLKSAYKSGRRIEQLEFEVSKLSAQLSELETIKKQNEEFQLMLQDDANFDLSEKTITVPLLSYANPAVASGENQGIKAGSMVVAHGTLLGIIDQVFSEHSTIKLISQDKNQKILAQTDTEVQGLITGDGKKVIMTEIPIDSEINKGQKVFTIGQAGIKKDVFIGEIIEINYEAESSVKQAVLEQYVDFNNVALVEVY